MSNHQAWSTFDFADAWLCNSQLEIRLVAPPDASSNTFLAFGGKRRISTEVDKDNMSGVAEPMVGVSVLKFLRLHSTKSVQKTCPRNAGKPGLRNHCLAVEYEMPASTANSLAFRAWSRARFSSTASSRTPASCLSALGDDWRWRNCSSTMGIATGSSACIHPA